MQWTLIIASAIEAITKLFGWLGYYRIKREARNEVENEILKKTAERIHSANGWRRNAPDDIDLLRPPHRRRKEGGNQ